MTEKLYYTDSHLFSFNATVLKCEKSSEDKYLTVLDRTAFFPEGGGQRADTGYISGVRVSHVFERDGEIYHKCETYLKHGSGVDCLIDSEQRLRRMQNHSGEHVVSGLIYRNFGFSNVGFHMGDSCMTIDFSGELSDADIEMIETTANEKIRENIPVRAWFPSKKELESINYRSKLDLTENVRLVSIEGCDICACCAPHVSSTGEIGMIKILSSMRHRGGTRLEVVCGMDALDNYRIRQGSAERISALLSAKQDEIAKAVERVLDNAAAQKEKIAALSMENALLKADAVDIPDGNICLFENLLDDIAIRELVNKLSERSKGIVCVFSGDDQTGYRYIIGSRYADLRKYANMINFGLEGKGGGSASMIQGRSSSGSQKIKDFIYAFKLN
ncbi:MAG: hypothetical protein K5771_09415 [Oscillospiraceae bacterium]|nr:hypothetical protein [Oscillospiraceae bacterium]